MLTCFDKLGPPPPVVFFGAVGCDGLVGSDGLVVSALLDILLISANNLPPLATTSLEMSESKSIALLLILPSILMPYNDNVFLCFSLIFSAGPYSIAISFNFSTVNGGKLGVGSVDFKPPSSCLGVLGGDDLPGTGGGNAGGSIGSLERNNALISFLSLLL